MKRAIGFIFIMVFSICILISCSTNDDSGKIQVDNMYNGSGKFDKDTIYISALKIDSPSNDSLIKSDILNFGVISFPEKVNPYFMEYEWDNYIVSAIWEPLMKKSYDGEFQPNILKQNPTISEDKKTYLFFLRSDLMWEDGTKLTTKDIEFTFKFLMDKSYSGKFNRDELNIRGWKDFRDGITENINGIEVLDEYSFKIIVDSVTSNTLDLLNIYPLALSYYGKNYFRDIAKEETIIKDKPFGNGVFKFADFSEGEYILLESNDFYFRGKSKIKNLTFKKISETNKIDEVKSGNIDLATSISFNNENILDVANSSFINGYAYDDYGYYCIGINHNNEFLKDVNLRKAIEIGVNREKINREIFNNNLSILNVPIDKRGVNLFLKDEYREDIYNKKEAIKILEEQGYTKSFDGIREKNGKKLEFRILVELPNEINNKIVLNLKQDLLALGIILNIENVNREVFNVKVKNMVSNPNNFDLCLNTPENNYYKSLTQSFLTGEKNNIYAYSNNELDSYLISLNTEFNMDDVEYLYNNVYKIIKEDIPVITLLQEKQFDIYNGRIIGINLVNRHRKFSFDEIILRK